MPRVAAILGISFAACLILSGGNGVSAQQKKPASPVKKFDEFGSVGHCDLTARLDNFAIQVQNIPRSKAYIVEYGPEIEGAGNERRNLAFARDYLLNTRGLEAARIKTIYGGRNNDLHQPKIQLWIIPKGVQPPEPEKYEPNISGFKGLFSDEETWDDFGIDAGSGGVDEMGPGIGRTTLASFAEMLQQQKDTVGYVVTYNGEDAAPGAWRRVAQNEIEILKRFNLDASRFKTVFGGQRKKTRVQLWIVAKHAPAPVPDAGPELPPLKTVNIGDFYSDSLSQEQNQIALFTRLTEILREQKTLRVFLVIRVPQAITEEEDEAPAVDEPEAAPATPAAPAEEETPTEEVNLTKLVEKWRVELAQKYKIDEDRFITLTIPATDQSNFLSLWVVPRGQPLPDPNEEFKQLEEETPPPSPKPSLTQTYADKRGF